MDKRKVQRAERSESPAGTDALAGELYLLLADISGYTGFMADVEQAHGVDFSAGIPAAYSVLGALLNAVISGVEPDFTLVKLEGDAVFAVAPAASLDGEGERVVGKLRAMYESFTEGRTRAIPASDHVCTACPAVAHLDLKVVLHRGHGFRPYLFLSDAAANALGLPLVGLAHQEEYKDAGLILGRIVELGEPAQEGDSSAIALR
jgi:hypothetical protein